MSVSKKATCHHLWLKVSNEQSKYKYILNDSLQLKDACFQRTRLRSDDVDLAVSVSVILCELVTEVSGLSTLVRGYTIKISMI
jgi:hypothetical protein